MKPTIIVFCPRCGLAVAVAVELYKVDTEYSRPIFHFKPTTGDHKCDEIQDET
jgi:hypothetical protein